MCPRCIVLRYHKRASTQTAPKKPGKKMKKELDFPLYEPFFLAGSLAPSAPPPDPIPSSRPASTRPIVTTLKLTTTTQKRK